MSTNPTNKLTIGLGYGHLALAMLLAMSSQRASITIRLVTSGQLARVRFLLSMREHVPVQVVVAFERLAALVAHKLALIAVRDHVLGEGALVGKLLPTLGTNEWTFARFLSAPGGHWSVGGAIGIAASAAAAVRKLTIGCLLQLWCRWRDRCR